MRRIFALIVFAYSGLLCPDTASAKGIKDLHNCLIGNVGPLVSKAKEVLASATNVSTPKLKKGVQNAVKHPVELAKNSAQGFTNLVANKTGLSSKSTPFYIFDERFNGDTATKFAKRLFAKAKGARPSPKELVDDLVDAFERIKNPDDILSILSRSDLAIADQSLVRTGFNDQQKIYRDRFNEVIKILRKDPEYQKHFKLLKERLNGAEFLDASNGQRRWKKINLDGDDGVFSVVATTSAPRLNTQLNAVLADPAKAADFFDGGTSHAQELQMRFNRAMQSLTIPTPDAKVGGQSLSEIYNAHMDEFFQTLKKHKKSRKINEADIVALEQANTAITHAPDLKAENIAKIINDRFLTLKARAKMSPDDLAKVPEELNAFDQIPLAGRRLDDTDIESFAQTLGNMSSKQREAYLIRKAYEIGADAQGPQNLSRLVDELKRQGHIDHYWITKSFNKRKTPWGTFHVSPMTGKVLFGLTEDLWKSFGNLPEQIQAEWVRAINKTIEEVPSIQRSNQIMEEWQKGLANYFKHYAKRIEEETIPSGGSSAFLTDMIEIMKEVSLIHGSEQPGVIKAVFSRLDRIRDSSDQAVLLQRGAREGHDLNRERRLLSGLERKFKGLNRLVRWARNRLRLQFDIASTYFDPEAIAKIMAGKLKNGPWGIGVLRAGIFNRGKASVHRTLRRAFAQVGGDVQAKDNFEELLRSLNKQLGGSEKKVAPELEEALKSLAIKNGSYPSNGWFKIVDDRLRLFPDSPLTHSKKGEQISDVDDLVESIFGSAPIAIKERLTEILTRPWHSHDPIHAGEEWRMLFKWLKNPKIVEAINDSSKMTLNGTSNEMLDQLSTVVNTMMGSRLRPRGSRQNPQAIFSQYKRKDRQQLLKKLLVDSKKKKLRPNGTWKGRRKGEYTKWDLASPNFNPWAFVEAMNYGLHPGPLSPTRWYALFNRTFGAARALAMGHGWAPTARGVTSHLFKTPRSKAQAFLRKLFVQHIDTYDENVAKNLEATVNLFISEKLVTKEWVDTILRSTVRRSRRQTSQTDAVVFSDHAFLKAVESKTGLDFSETDPSEINKILREKPDVAKVVRPLIKKAKKRVLFDNGFYKFVIRNNPKDGTTHVKAVPLRVDGRPRTRQTRIAEAVDDLKKTDKYDPSDLERIEGILSKFRPAANRNSPRYNRFDKTKSVLGNFTDMLKHFKRHMGNWWSTYIFAPRKMSDGARFDDALERVKHGLLNEFTDVAKLLGKEEAFKRLDMVVNFLNKVPAKKVKKQTDVQFFWMRTLADLKRNLSLGGQTFNVITESMKTEILEILQRTNFSMKQAETLAKYLHKIPWEHHASMDTFRVLIDSFGTRWSYLGGIGRADHRRMVIIKAMDYLVENDNFRRAPEILWRSLRKNNGKKGQVFNRWARHFHAVNVGALKDRDLRAAAKKAGLDVDNMSVRQFREALRKDPQLYRRIGPTMKRVTDRYSTIFRSCFTGRFPKVAKWAPISFFLSSLIVEEYSVLEGTLKSGREVNPGTGQSAIDRAGGIIPWAGTIKNQLAMDITGAAVAAFVNTGAVFSGTNILKMIGFQNNYRQASGTIEGAVLALVFKGMDTIGTPLRRTLVSYFQKEKPEKFYIDRIQKQISKYDKAFYRDRLDRFINGEIPYSKIYGGIKSKAIEKAVTAVLKMYRAGRIPFEKLPPHAREIVSRLFRVVALEVRQLERKKFAYEATLTYVKSDSFIDRFRKNQKFISDQKAYDAYRKLVDNPTMDWRRVFNAHKVEASSRVYTSGEKKGQQIDNHKLNQSVMEKFDQAFRDRKAKSVRDQREIIKEMTDKDFQLKLDLAHEMANLGDLYNRSSGIRWLESGLTVDVSNLFPWEMRKVIIAQSMKLALLVKEVWPYGFAGLNSAMTYWFFYRLLWLAPFNGKLNKLMSHFSHFLKGEAKEKYIKNGKLTIPVNPERDDLIAKKKFTKAELEGIKAAMEMVHDEVRKNEKAKKVKKEPGFFDNPWKWSTDKSLTLQLGFPYMALQFYFVFQFICNKGLKIPRVPGRIGARININKATQQLLRSRGFRFLSVQLQRSKILDAFVAAGGVLALGILEKRFQGALLQNRNGGIYYRNRDLAPINSLTNNSQLKLDPEEMDGIFAYVKRTSSGVNEVSR